MGGLPPYKENPIHQAVRVKEDPDDGKADAFKPPTMHHLPTPTPSISLNKFNLKKETTNHLTM